MNAMLVSTVSVTRATFIVVLAIFSVLLAVSAAPLTERDSGFITGGVATYFYQNDNAGACGTVHSDNDVVAAMDSGRYNQGLCGKKVFIRNTKNGKSVTVTIADECPTCENSNSIDLSVGAFTQIATKEEGEVPIQWKYV
ncbi:barwin-like endoglucanase [Neolentinus lepideus HHB14362 ss-1]|uniref:Barwin-like endoglucanase n=1 Tax=Neolentinus lepideus HHB14362 ss-1 TaxID=1314782 RepID=A0A165MV16_9AGAM|nr:barwin-like endoglucanase [Neolentinus lepideus HHB14362 ss-1]